MIRIKSLARRPFTWLILGEMVVVASLGVVAWRFFTPNPTRAATSAGGRVPGSDGHSRPTAPPSPHPTGGHSSPTPPPRPASSPRPSAGVAMAPDLQRINGEQASWEAAQWRITKTLTEAARLYLERVVMPAVEKAERHATERGP